MPEQDDCYDAVVDRETLLTRTLVVFECVRSMVAYRGFLDAASQAREHCPAVASMIPDRAYANERHTRILIKETLDTINELRDSGRLQQLFLKAPELLHDLDLGARIGEAREQLRQIDPRLDLEALDEVAPFLERVGFKAEPGDAGTVAVTMAGPDGEVRRVVLDGSIQPGATGRVGPAQFFGSTREGLVLSSIEVFVPADCHHRPQIPGAFADGRVVDAYGAALGGLANLKELSYRHARKVEEIGHGRIEGAELLTAIAIIAIVAGAVMVFVGIVTNNENLIGGGIFLMVMGSLGVLFGVKSIEISLTVPIA